MANALSELSLGRARARALSERLRLSFGQQKGIAGNWLGVGSGSSIDYQDHRPFLPGDDPRYLDWKAYARTGQYTMKVYREEMTPQVDVLLDLTPSMFFLESKQLRVMELLYFVLESALRIRASVVCYGVAADGVRRLDVEELLAAADTVAPVEGPARAPLVERVPLRARSLRLLISDLLFGGPPRPIVQRLVARRGQARILAPYALEEVEPEEGNRELIDVESGERRVQRFHPESIRRFRESYRRHFEMWRQECRRHDALLCRVPATVELESALEEAMRQGVVIPWH